MWPSCQSECDGEMISAWRKRTPIQPVLRGSVRRASLRACTSTSLQHAHRSDSSPCSSFRVIPCWPSPHRLLMLGASVESRWSCSFSQHLGSWHQTRSVHSARFGFQTRRSSWPEHPASALRRAAACSISAPGQAVPRNLHASIDLRVPDRWSTSVYVSRSAPCSIRQTTNAR
jgi:hypothetical protein